MMERMSGRVHREPHGATRESADGCGGGADAPLRPRVLFVGRFIRDRVFAPALAGVRRYAHARGWDVETVDWDEARSGSPRTLRAAPRPLGFIVEGSDRPPDLPLRLYGGAPVVFCNCPRAPRGPRFAHLLLDEAAVARIAFRELSASLPPACAVVEFWLGRRNWSDDRAAAFRTEAARSGLPCPSFAFLDPRNADASGEPGRLAAWLSSLPRHSAIFAVNDETAVRVLEAAHTARLHIPRDLTLLGADNDTAICESSRPTLSSLQMDFESAGFQAARLLGYLMTRSGTSDALRPSVAIGPLMSVWRESTRGTGRREPRILEAVKMIRREACDGLDAGTLAARFPGSRRLFELRFREAMGHSVLDEILHVRMEKVHTLLAGTDTPLSAIADFCGFHSDRALRKLFFSREGMSMTEWRRLHRQ